MKSLRTLALLAVVVIVAPVLSAADFGVRAGRVSDIDEDFVGAEMLFQAGRININPNIEYWLTDDDVTAGTANLDVTFDIINVARVTPYVGAGVGLFYADSDFGNETEIVGNLIGGVSFNLDFLQPYAQVKYFQLLDSEGDDDDLALVIGLRF